MGFTDVASGDNKLQNNFAEERQQIIYRVNKLCNLAMTILFIEKTVLRPKLLDQINN